MINERRCPACNEVITGRRDKKFCNDYCRSAFHYNRNAQKEPTMFQFIDRQLKDNRRILKDFNKGGKVTVRKEVLQNEGFNPKYFTHYWKNEKGQVYLFCYEYGYLTIKERGRQKYVLVTWQQYMNS